MTAFVLLPVLASASVHAADDAQLLTQALDFYQQKKFDQAESLFNDLHSRSPQQAAYLNNLAAVQMAKGDTEQALKTLQQAMETDESYATAQRNINELYAYKASLAYAKALDKDDTAKVPQLLLITHLSQQSILATADTQLAAQANTPETVIPETVTPETVAAPSITPLPDETTARSAAETVVESDLPAQLTQLTGEWAQAWMQSDVEHYLGLYAANFNPDGSTSHEDWLNQRRYRLRNSKQVQVTYNQLQVFVRPDQSSAIVEFVQFYESGNYKDKVRKQLQWVRSDDGSWHIQRETVIETL